MDQRVCKYCIEPIHQRASVCQHCGRSQPLGSIQLIMELASTINALIAVGLLILGLFQFLEAKRDRVNADQALKEALAVKHKNEELSAEQQRMVSGINAEFEQLFSGVCEVAHGAYDSGSGSCVLKNGKRIPFDQAVQDVTEDKKTER